MKYYYKEHSIDSAGKRHVRFVEAKLMPSRAAIVGLCNTVRSLDNAIGITCGMKRALEKVERQLKGK